MKKIPTACGKQILVDNADFGWITKLGSWFLANGYPARRREGPLHQLLMKPPKGFEVDHINRNPLDNRRKNLRVCTHAQNLMNVVKPRANTTGFKGVTFNKACKRFIAQITVDGIKIHIGLFDYAQDAADTYDLVAVALAGKFARTNKTRKKRTNAFSAYRKAIGKPLKE